MLSKVHNREEGFTLIELMIVIAIIGILAAIAIPQFNAYRARSYNASANTDLRNAMTSEEGYFIDKDTYTDVVADLTSSMYGLVLSDGVEMNIVNVTATAYEIHTWNSKAGERDRAVTYTVAGPGGEIGKQTP